MAEQKHRFLITYDIRDAKRLRKVHRTLLGSGTHAQYSVFICRLTMRQYRFLRWRLECIMEPEDALLAVRLTPSCLWETRGPGPLDLGQADPSFVII